MREKKKETEEGVGIINNTLEWAEGSFLFVGLSTALNISLFLTSLDAHESEAEWERDES